MQYQLQSNCEICDVAAGSDFKRSEETAHVQRRKFSKFSVDFRSFWLVRLLLHDEKVVEAAKEVIAIDGRLLPVWPFEVAVVANHRNDVNWMEALTEQFEKTKADRAERFSFSERVTAVKAEVASVL